jgi:hypothetical protein
LVPRTFNEGLRYRFNEDGSVSEVYNYLDKHGYMLYDFDTNTGQLDNAFVPVFVSVKPITIELDSNTNLEVLKSSVLHKHYSDKLTKEELESISGYIPQGPELRNFIMDHPVWIYFYYITLQGILVDRLNWEPTKPGLLKAYRITKLFKRVYGLDKIGITKLNPELKGYGYFRYSAEYGTVKDNLPIPKTKLPIDECINLYKEYVSWKMRVL